MHVWFPDPSCMDGVRNPPIQEGSGNQTSMHACLELRDSVALV